MTDRRTSPANMPDIVLKDGHSTPRVGLDVLRIDDEGVVPVTESVLEAGCRHTDDAAGCDNGVSVGRALTASGYNKGAKHETLWVTIKLCDSQRGYDSALKAFDNSLELLQPDCMGMYMVHWLTPSNWRNINTWKVFIRLCDEGIARTLDVYDLMPADLRRLHEETDAWPAVNQIELYPTWQQREVVAFCKEHGITVETYSPTARGADISADDGTIEEIAAVHEVDPAQVILCWYIENGAIIIPKSVYTDHQKENFSLFGFTLTADKHAAIDTLDGPACAGHDPLIFTYAWLMVRRNAHFCRRFNASGPLERALILIVLVVVIGVTIGLLLPQVGPDVAKITGGYTATGSATGTLDTLAVDGDQSSSGYDRDSFDFRTTDVDGNDCDVRGDVLARDLTDITYKYAGSCMTESGTLADPHTAQTIHFVRGCVTSTKVQINHMVALENAWQSGARDWSAAKHHGFGDSPYNLLVVDGPVNQEKGSASATYWPPTDADYRCDHMVRQTGVKDKYQLTVTLREKDAMLAVLHTRPGQAVPVGE